MRKYIIIFLLAPLVLMGMELHEKLICPESIDNSLKCAEYLEGRIIETLKFVKRDNDRLSITTTKGKTIKIEHAIEPKEHCRYYYVVDYLSEVDLVVIYCQYWEGGDFMAIDRKTGKQTDIKGYPLLSPGKKEFVVSSFDIEAEYSANLLSIYEITKKGYKMVLTIEPKGWGPTNVEWVDENTVKLNKTMLGTETQYLKEPMEIIKTNGIWKVKE